MSSWLRIIQREQMWIRKWNEIQLCEISFNPAQIWCPKNWVFDRINKCSPYLVYWFRIRGQHFVKYSNLLLDCDRQFYPLFSRYQTVSYIIIQCLWMKIFEHFVRLEISMGIFLWIKITTAIFWFSGWTDPVFNIYGT